MNMLSADCGIQLTATSTTGGNAAPVPLANCGHESGCRHTDMHGRVVTIMQHDKQSLETENDVRLHSR